MPKRVPAHFHLFGFLAFCALVFSSALLSASALSKSSTTASDSTSHPPAPPGHAWLEVVEYTVTLAGDPEDFNQTQFKRVLADLLPVVEPEDVQLRVTSGSTIVKAFITTSLVDDVVYIRGGVNRRHSAAPHSRRYSSKPKSRRGSASVVGSLFYIIYCLVSESGIGRCGE